MGEVMEISEHIIREAEEILSTGQTLPQQIPSAPQFFVSLDTDETIHAFSAVKVNGAVYKIGTKKVVH